MYRHCLDEAASATTRQSEPKQPAGSKIKREFGGQSHCGIPPQLLPQGGPVTFNLVTAQTAGGYWHKQTHCSLPASISSLDIFYNGSALKHRPATTRAQSTAATARQQPTQRCTPNNARKHVSHTPSLPCLITGANTSSLPSHLQHQFFPGGTLNRVVVSFSCFFDFFFRHCALLSNPTLFAHFPTHAPVQPSAVEPPLRLLGRRTSTLDPKLRHKSRIKSPFSSTDPTSFLPTET